VPSLADTASELGELIESLWAIGDVVAFAAHLGFDLRAISDDLGPVTTAAGGVLSALGRSRELVSQIGDLEDPEDADATELGILVGELVLALIDCFGNLQTLASAFDGPMLREKLELLAGDLGPATFGEEFLSRAVGWVVCRHLARRRPFLLATLELVGVLRREPLDLMATDNGSEFTVDRIDLSQLGRFLHAPSETLRSLHRFGQTDFSADALLTTIEELLLAKMVPATRTAVPADLTERLEGLLEAEFSERDVTGLGTVLWETPALGLLVQTYAFVVPTTSKPTLPGLGIAFAVEGGAIDLDLGNGLSLLVDAGTSATVALGLVPDHLLFFNDFADPSRSEVKVRATFQPTLLRPFVVLGSATSSRLEIGGIGLAAGIEASLEAPAFLNAEFTLVDTRLAIDTTTGDGFISKLLPSLKVDSSFDLTVGFNSKGEVYIRGSGGIDITLPIHASIGPILVEAVHLALRIGGDGALPVELAVTASAKLGPVLASVSRIGARFTISFPADGKGTLGPIDISPSFKSPEGVGLAIDGGGIRGGGFVEYTEADKSYAGILALSFGEIALTAVGLITTKMPDGSKGFALLIVIGVEFNPAIQLSFGFTLSGVGGLLAVNRTMAVDVLRQGLKQHTLDSILFPEDPILNAPKIISDLKAVFPVEEGRFIVGPMVKIGWGPNKMVEADIGIFIELPDPVRIVLLGAISVLLPKPKDALVELHIDVLGVLDFSKKTLEIDATIYDSRILDYPLYGDAALRFSWGTPQLCASLGGFHPNFSPPPGFPNLRRLTLDLSTSKSLELSCKAYQALTSNTLQFGARIDLHAAEGGASLDGDLSFDALIYFSPFSFSIDLAGGMVARYKGHDLAGVRLELGLSGPTPWRAKGRASFEILAWDITVSFDKSWGRSGDATLEAIKAWEKLREELALPSSWGASLPGGSMVEALKALDEAEAAHVLHPAGTLEVRQMLLPLKLKLDKVGNAPIEGPSEFRFTQLTVRSKDSTVATALDVRDVNEHFGRGQFFDLSAQQKLSLPAFEQLAAGIGGTSAELQVIGSAVPCAVTYESVVINLATASVRTTVPSAWTESTLRRGAAARTLATRRRLDKYRVRGKVPTVVTSEPGYQLVSAADLTPMPDDMVVDNGGCMTRMHADQALAAYLGSHPGQAKQVFVMERSTALAACTEEPEVVPSATTIANYCFLNAIRKGLAVAIKVEPTSARACLVAELAAEGLGSPPISHELQLYGPGDVLGFDARIVTRTDPLPNVGDFEPNYFPAIEFADADFPWRFSHATVSGDNKTLKPWIVLIVLEESEFEFRSKGANATLPWIKVGKPGLSACEVLPKLDSAPLWAHVQLTAGAAAEGATEATIETQLANAESTAPERLVSRLVCPRVLKETTRYHAFVVPAFKLGTVAAGRAQPGDSDVPLTPAWTDETERELNYYFHLPFGTSKRGDFEYLVKLLEPRVLQKLGLRNLDCSTPGFGLPPVERLGVDPSLSSVLELEGALQSLDTEYTDWGFAVTDGRTTSSSTPLAAASLQFKLASELLNKPAKDRAPQAIDLTSSGAPSITEVRITLKPQMISIVDPTTGETIEVAGFGAQVSWVMPTAVTGQVELGETTTYSLTGAAPSRPLSVSFPDVKARQAYQMRLTGFDVDGTVVARSSNLTFETPAFPLPTVVPPIYGGWYAGRRIVEPPKLGPPSDVTTWFEEVNLDPRHRAAAGFGALLVERQQEALMASAWDQLGAIDDANELLRRGQLGREAASALFDRLKDLELGDFFRVTAPVHARIALEGDEGKTTVARRLASSRIPAEAFDPALRRVWRRRGPVRRRQQAAPALNDMLVRMSGGETAVTSPGVFPLQPDGMVSVCSITDMIAPARIGSDFEPGITVEDHGTTLAPLEPTFCGPAITCESLRRLQDLKTLLRRRFRDSEPDPAGIVVPSRDSGRDDDTKSSFAGLADLNLEAIREAMCGALDTLLVPDEPPGSTGPTTLNLEELRPLIENALNPAVTVTERVLARIALNLAPDAAEREDPLEPITSSPEFPQPMYESLKEISQDLILPGVETVPQNTIGLLQSNRRFIEACMLGVNSAFTGEALWRGLAIGGRSTYARQFWNVEDAIATAAPATTADERALRAQLKDMREIRCWNGARLGANPQHKGCDRGSAGTAHVPEDALVVLVRGDLLKKYPDTLVYVVAADGAVPPAPSSDLAKRIVPVFSGTLAPDLSFFGFPFTEAQARQRGDGAKFPTGAYVVLEQRPGEPRFGVDEGSGAEPSSPLGDSDGLSLDYLRDESEGTALAAGEHIDGTVPSPLTPALTTMWQVGSAGIAAMTLQKPVRVAVHFDRMLPEEMPPG
jgi:hypothetical protein